MKSTRLEELREEHNSTKKEIAKALKVSTSIYCRWENDKDSIPTIRLNELANFYNINIDYILRLTNNKVTMKKSIINKNLISARTRELRMDMKYTLRDIAKILNTTSSTWSAYETGKTLILSSFLIKICQISKISVDWLLGRTDNPKIPN